MIGIVVKNPDDKLLGALLFQRCREFRVYVAGQADDAFLADYEGRLRLVRGGLDQVEEPLCVLLEAGALPDRDWVRRILRTCRRHPAFDVYHVNLPGEKKWPRKLKLDRLFRMTVLEQRPAPLSTFVFRTEILRTRAVFKADGTLDTLPTVLSCAERPVRNVWRQTLTWTPPAVPQDPASVEKRIRERLEALRWCEQYFGEDRHPLDAGERLALYARELARLYPTYSADELKEEMNLFQTAQGTIRKFKASQALKSALKKRQKELA